MLTAIAAFCATVAPAGSSWACPSCPVGELARRQVCEQGFTQNLLIATLPFFAIIFAAAIAERIGKAKS